MFTASAWKPELSSDLREFVKNQAFAVASAVAILSPETVVIEGGICEMPNFPKAELESELEERFPFVHTGRPLDGSAVGITGLAQRTLRSGFFS